MAIEKKDNELFRDGTKVAVLDENGNIKEYVNGGEKYRLPIANKLKGLLGKAEASLKVSDTAVQTWEIPVHTAFPDAPGRDSKLGDKDPTLVRWIYQNYPEDFAHRYKGRKTIMDEDKPKEKTETQLAIEAQTAGHDDATFRRGYKPEGYSGVFQREYKVGYKLGGGIINE